MRFELVDALLSAIRSAPQGHTLFVFNCHLGRTRSTVAMVMAGLALWRQVFPTDADETGQVADAVASTATESDSHGNDELALHGQSLVRSLVLTVIVRLIIVLICVCQVNTE